MRSLPSTAPRPSTRSPATNNECRSLTAAQASQLTASSIPGRRRRPRLRPAYTAYSYIPDFYFFGPTAEFAGGTLTYDFTGVLTPSGDVELSLKYAAL